MNTLLLWLSIFLCLAAIGALQFRLFGGTVKTRSPGNVASFFFMHEIVDKQQRNLLSVIALIPLSFVFLIVAYHAETFGKALVQTYLEYFKQEKALEPFISPDLVSNIPEPLYPIIILVASFLIFGAQLRFLFIRIEKGVVFVTGVISRTNELLDEFSTAKTKTRPWRARPTARSTGSTFMRVPWHSSLSAVCIWVLHRWPRNSSGPTKLRGRNTSTFRISRGALPG